MNRIAIIMEGGLIQDILADEEVDITIVDYDTEDAEEEDLTEVPQNDGTSVEAFIGYPNVRPLRRGPENSSTCSTG